MQLEDRVIHFSTELIHPPIPLRTQPLQKLYFELSQTRSAGYDSTDFSNPQQVKFYSRRGKKTQSLAIFLPDRTMLVEEWADLPLVDFLDRVREVGVKAMRAREIPVYVAHTGTIRSTFALTHYKDARVFLLDHVCQQEGRIDPFLGRPISLGGLRFVLPETNEHRGTLHVTIESYRHSRHEIFVEAKGVFGRQPVGPGDLDVVLENLRMTRAFISDHIHPYLDQYDQPQAENS